MLKFIQEVATLTKTSKIRNVLPGSDPMDVVTLAQLNSYGVTSPYRVYTALITQSGGSAPTITTQLENTLGNIVWTRSSDGVYVGTLAGAFSTTKTFVSFTNNNLCFLAMYANDENTVRIATSNTAGAAADDLLTGSIEIRTYN